MRNILLMSLDIIYQQIIVYNDTGKVQLEMSKNTSLYDKFSSRHDPTNTANSQFCKCKVMCRCSENLCHFHNHLIKPIICPRTFAFLTKNKESTKALHWHGKEHLKYC